VTCSQTSSIDWGKWLTQLPAKTAWGSQVHNIHTGGIARQRRDMQQESFKIKNMVDIRRELWVDTAEEHEV
jgi:hypothetical protein